MLTIVLTGGGSGGHITPLLSLAHELRKQKPQCQIIYIGLKGEKLEGLQSRYQAFSAVRFVPAGKFRRYHGQSFLATLADLRTVILNIGDSFKVLAGILAARRILKELKPAVVFSKGGFVAVPVGMAAHWQKIPIITHDSDALPSLTNKILGRWAAVHATGMAPTYYDYPPASMRYVGIPVDERIKPVSKADQESFKKQLGLPAGDLVLLIGGAGLGSRELNDKVIQITPDLLQTIKNLQIIHIAGVQHQSAVEAAYAQKLPAHKRGRVKVLGFTDEFYKYTGAADLVISRAGATTLAELALQKKAVLLMPAPFLSGGHQLKNAEQLKNLQAAEVVDNNVTPEKLFDSVVQLLQGDKKRARLATNLAATAHPNAAKDLAAIILEVAGAAKLAA